MRKEEQNCHGLHSDKGEKEKERRRTGNIM